MFAFLNTLHTNLFIQHPAYPTNVPKETGIQAVDYLEY